MPDELEQLERLKKRAATLKAEEAEVRKKIEAGFVSRVIVFIDVVGSTKFKLEHAHEREVWVLRIRQFSMLLASAIQDAKGRVVKYIGDEVMAVFDDPHDALGLVADVERLEEQLWVATDFETRIKVAVDFGPVYSIKFEGHDEPDPQGTAVDRCARIGKHCEAGEVLASEEFRLRTPQLDWHPLGEVAMKGLKEKQAVFQLERSTIDLAEKMEVTVAEWESLKEARAALEERVAVLEEKNAGLVGKLKSLGGQLAPEDLAEDDAGDLFNELADAANKALGPLPVIIVEALYSEIRGEAYVPGDVESARRADEETYADFDETDGTFQAAGDKSGGRSRQGGSRCSRRVA